MLLSTKTQLILLLTTIFLLLASGIGTFVLQRAEKNLSDMQLLSIQNTLHQAEHSILSFQRILFTTKSAQALAVKSTLHRSLSTLQQMSVVTEEDALKFLLSFPLPKDIMLSVLDEKLRVIYQDERLPYGLTQLADIKGRIVGKTAIHAQHLGDNTAFIVKAQKNGQEQSLYGEHFILLRDNLLVGLWKNIVTSEAMYKRAYANNLQALNEEFSNVRFGQEGFLFVVNHKGENIIGPPLIKANLADAVTAQGAPLMDFLRHMHTGEAVHMLDAELLKPAHWEEDNPRNIRLYTLYVKQLDWYVVGGVFEETAQEHAQELFRSFMMALCVVMVCILPAAILILTRMTAPLSKLSHHVRTFPEQDFTQEKSPDNFLEQLAAETYSIELHELANSFIFMDKTLRARVQELMKSTSQRERMEGELAAAIEIQKGILPKPLSAQALAGRADIAFVLIPAHQVGGDLYDFFFLEEDKLCFVIGDVSGKGMSAALFMSMALTLVRSHAKKDMAIEELVTIVNNSLAHENSTCMFVTLLVGVLDLKTGHISYVNAGHSKPLILKKDGELETLHGLSGLVVGAMTGVSFITLETQLTPGDTFFLYTDGVTEAMNNAENEYGALALEAVLNSNIHRDPQDIIDNVLHDVAQHVDGAPAFDDVTMLCMRWNGEKAFEDDAA